MPIFCYGEPTLFHFTSLLHDLYFTLPNTGLSIDAGKTTLRFSDQDFILRKDSVSEFSLAVLKVTHIRVEGQPDRCPDVVQLNRFRYKRKEHILALHAVHPVQIMFYVEGLHLELDQLA